MQGSIKKQKMKRIKENGITIISIVVTVIILIILAGVSISLVVGKNGLFTKAQESVRKTEIAQVKENIRLDLLNLQTEKEDNNFILEESDIESVLKKYGTITKNEDGSIKSLTPTGKNYEISYEELQIGLLVTGDSDKDHNTGSGSGGTTGGSQDKVEITREEYDALVERLNAIDGGTKSSVSLSDVNNSIDSKTADIKTNIAEINQKLPTFHNVSISKNITSTTVYSKTDLSITIPANSYVCITFRAIYNLSRPEYIEVRDNSSYAAGGVLAHGVASCTISEYIDKATTYTAYTLWNNNGYENGGMIEGYYITFPE